MLAPDIIDSKKRIKKFIKSSKKKFHRSLFTVLGPDCSKQIRLLLETLNKKNLSCLWCSNKTDSTQKSHKPDLKDLPENVLFSICSYRNFEDFVKNTYDILVLEDIDNKVIKFLPMLLQSVKGGGIVVFSFPNCKSIEDIKSNHKQSTRTDSNFFGRLVECLTTNNDSLVVGDKYTHQLFKLSEIKEAYDHTATLNQINELNNGQDIFKDLVPLCQTVDQAKVLVECITLIKNRTERAVLSMSSLIGRGKSAVLGLAIAAAVACQYSNIYLSSMRVGNVETVFKFMLLGIEALHYEEDKDFDLIASVNPDFSNALIGLNVFRDHPQTVRFVLPKDMKNKLNHAELVVFDEAAEIPLNLLTPHTKGKFIVLMASSIFSLGAPSSHLYDKMIETIRPKSALTSELDLFKTHHLVHPIHYAPDDPVEKWFNRVLSIGCDSEPITCGYPHPEQCQLFALNRDALYDCSEQSELILQILVQLLTSSSRQIDADFLIRLADSPDYRIFCLLPPIESSTSFPGILCAILVHLEQQVPENIIRCGINVENSQSHCFNDWKTKAELENEKFEEFPGVHITSIVTQRSHRRMGYGIRAVRLLQEFYEGKCISLLDDNPVDPSSILLQLNQVKPDPVSYFLTTFRLSSEVLRFWKKLKFVPIFIDESPNSEGEHHLSMLQSLDEDFLPRLPTSWSCFHSHTRTQLARSLKVLPPGMALNLLVNDSMAEHAQVEDLSKVSIDFLIPPRRMKVLERCCQNLKDFSHLREFLPTLAKLYFARRIQEVKLSTVQEAILLSCGLQLKKVSEVSSELNLKEQQINSQLIQMAKRLLKNLTHVIEKDVEKTMEVNKNNSRVMEPVKQSLDDELEEAAKQIRQQQSEDAKKLLSLDVSQYAIKGSEDDWQRALLTGRNTLVSIKSLKKPPVESSDIASDALQQKQQGPDFKGKSKHQGKEKSKFQGKEKSKHQGKKRRH